MCRWPNGDLSFVSARNKEDAIIQLDEWDNAELAELRQIRSFMVDFRLTDAGDLKLLGFGEECMDRIWESAYPILTQTTQDVPRNLDGELMPPSRETIRKAVAAEKQRLLGKKRARLADTELGKHIQSQLGAPAAMINRYTKRAAAETLKKLPTSGRKQ